MRARQVQPAAGKTFPTNTPVDFVVIGSGVGGASVARELTRQGFDVVMLEQGRMFGPEDMEHDEIGAFLSGRWGNDPVLQPQTFRKSPKDKAQRRNFVQYAKAVGGTTFHFTGNYWRLRPIDFNEFSVRGGVPGAALADWPITYDELEPYYTAVEWAVGVSGEVSTAKGEPHHSKPYPLPPLNVHGPGVLLEVGAKKLGWSSKAAPMALLSRPYQGRQPCHNCGFCLAFPCEWGAKGANYTMVPDALKSGRCELRSESYVRKIETDDSGRVTGVIYFDKDKKEIVQRAKAVVLSANGAETPRLLLMSKSNRFPDGLANSSGVVGKHFMINGAGIAKGEFEHEVNPHKGPVVTRITQELYELDPTLNLIGGGGYDFRISTPALLRTADMPADDRPQWGAGFKEAMRSWFHNSLDCYGHTTSLPVETNAISLDPDLKDAWGLPAMRVTYKEHEHDLRLYHHFRDRAKELLTAAGATKVHENGISDDPGSTVHVLGTCRMGNDPKTSVVDKYHRAHDVKNLFIVDGSSLVTSTRGQPTLTIQALAFRAGDFIGQAAKKGEI